MLMLYACPNGKWNYSHFSRMKLWQSFIIIFKQTVSYLVLHSFISGLQRLQTCVLTSKCPMIFCFKGHLQDCIIYSFHIYSSSTTTDRQQQPICHRFNCLEKILSNYYKHFDHILRFGHLLVLTIIVEGRSLGLN